MSFDCTILILTYKGKHHLEHLLPSVTKTLQHSSGWNIEVLIVDNGHDAATKQYIQSNYPEYRVEWSTENAYLFSLNYYVEKLDSEIVLILNDDMRLDTEVLNQGLPIILEDKGLFCLACRVLDWVGQNDTTSVRIMTCKNGWLNSFFVPVEDKKPRYTLYGGGGASFYKVDKFIELGGFNDLYKPAYAEDLDLGHRAWHHGWPSVFYPKAFIYHREGGTIHEQFASTELEKKITRNNILWMLRNGDSNNFLLLFFVFFPYRLVQWGFRKSALFKALLLSIPYWAKAIQQRLKDDPNVLSDNDIMQRLNQEYVIER